MASNLYWISTLVFAVVLLFILITDCLINKTESTLVKYFRVLLCWVIYFCCQDTLWGLCASKVINNDQIFFASSTVFHCSTVLTTFFWLFYVLKYLGSKIKYTKYYLLIDALVILSQFILLIKNCYNPLIFTIENGEYITQYFRLIVFLNQYVVYLAIGLITLIGVFKEKSEAKRLYFSVLLCSLSPIVTGYFQLLYLDSPFYSIGYFVCCVVIYLTVVYNEMEKSKINAFLQPLTNIYYSLHLVDLKKDEIKGLLSSEVLDAVLKGRKKNFPKLMEEVITATVEPVFKKNVSEFTNIQTLTERTKGQQIIQTEFLGTHYGWMNMNIIPFEWNIDGNVTKFFIGTRIIDNEKKYEQKLLQKSNTDKLSGLLNRRAYEDDIAYYSEQSRENSEFIFLSLDINGLKVVNDTLGHEAGDELIIGAVNCITEFFSNIGNFYRTGGDEFIGIIKQDLINFENRLASFKIAVSQWKGNQVDSLAISCGWVRSSEFPEKNFLGIARIADQRMYQDKTKYYREKGVDRRGHSLANSALCNLYNKILKINITNNNYSIIKLDSIQKDKEKGFSETISDWFLNFTKSGMIHQDDVSDFLRQTDINYLKKYFNEGNNRLSILYRRKFSEGFNNVVMDIIRADDYTDDHQSLFLYVRSI